jgi:ATP-binding protein involved in chromosome partitioning
MSPPGTSPGATPVGIAQDGPRALRIEWRDGHVSRYAVRDLRLACRCARCVDEHTGRPLLVAEGVPEDVRPVRVSPVGRYAIQITWTDGHDSGIYSFEYLRDLGASEV